ncbi:PKD domain-containing protein [candidate division KSB1 bacterium]|nr:PKD domain-containing protein [candidate division KSB1 bacterium]
MFNQYIFFRCFRGHFFVFLLFFTGFFGLNTPVHAQCNADFVAQPTIGCPGMDVWYTDNSTGAAQWIWTFSGGTPSSATGPGPHKITYNTVGNWDAKLVINCKQGGDTETKLNFITVKNCDCTANFTASPTTGCPGVDVKFTDNSVNAVSWSWSFPGGYPGSAQGKGPHTISYNKPGDYDVTLQIVCPNGNDSKTVTDMIHVDECPCEADFTGQPRNGCAPLEVKFTDNSPYATSWAWQFPGGTPANATGKGPHTVIYNTPGTYPVTLEIQCENGSDKKTKNSYITVLDCTCEADFTGTPTSGDAPLPVLFTDNSTNANSWVWSFPGGTPSSAQGIGPHQVTYNNPGDYDVSLEITCDNGSDIVVKDDYIHVNAFIPLYEYGDAPEGVIAYPSTGVIGNFPTCKNVGPAGYVQHGSNHNSFLGNHADFEVDGNEGLCPVFGDKYDQDESCYEADAGLWTPDAFTIVQEDGVLKIVKLCEEFKGKTLGYTCGTAHWGTDSNINLWFDTHNPDGAYVNVLIDWNQDGSWGGSSRCDEQNFAPEHVLKNFHVPGASNGHLSVLDPPDFRIGPYPGYVWIRLTITKNPIPLPWDGSGIFSEGESEDYLIKISDRSGLMDFGDAPFGTLLADGGAHHLIADGVFLGVAVDAEDDGQPDPHAMGDDKKDVDDEDGVEFKTDMFIGQTATMEITASVNGMLKAWIDYNQDQDWDDPGEQVLNHQLSAGVNSLSIVIPDEAKEGTTYARFRFSQQDFDSPYDVVETGEVEDYEIEIRPFLLDFGDAPAPFPTTMANNGARHLVSDLYLGEFIDWEGDGINSPGADADDKTNKDDEDGIEFVPPLVPGYPFQMRITPSNSGWLNAWIDYNQDNDWDDPQDHLIIMEVAPRADHPELPNVRSIRIPTDAVIGDAAARFRLSSARDISYDGFIPDGEVEDYILPIGFGMDWLDWGDAPDPPYPTLSINDGARHIVNYHIGVGDQDIEPDGQPNADATGDDINNIDDEDFIEFLTPLLPGDSASIKIWPNDHCFVNTWIDFNSDGDWDDADEHCIVDKEMYNMGEPDTIAIYVPEYTINGYSFGRFRISYDPGIGYTGLAVFGEVEDYKIALGDIASCVSDSLALVALYHSTNGPAWTDHTNWLTGPVDTWHGIEIENCRVKGVRLGINNLTGTLPPEIGDLTAMEVLYLRDNAIEGTIPPELGKCQASIYIDISNNLITGPIPPELGQLSNCTDLIIEGCELIGTIPPEIGDLGLLEHLSFGRNNLVGTIPLTIYDMPELQVLNLASNSLTGEIPPEIAHLTQLQNLRLFGNDFSGPLPDELFDLSELRHLWLSDNHFSGPIPVRMADLTDLLNLYLYSNEFSGPIPDEIYKLTELRSLILANNQLIGGISPEIENLVNLEDLRIEMNDFHGEIPDEITALHALEIFNLHHNRFNELPDLSALSALSFLRIHDNQFTFEDIEPNIGVPDFEYSPQDSIGVTQDTTVVLGAPLKLYSETHGSANHYTWVHDGVDIPGLDAAVLPFTAIAFSDSGKYICRITSDVATELTLYCRTIHVRVDGSSDVQRLEKTLPEKYALQQNYPNPFNPTTTFQYELPNAGHVQLTIYDVAGRQVRSLVDKHHQPGVYNIKWNATDDKGLPVAAGLYLCRMKAGDFVQVRKLAFVK